MKNLLTTLCFTFLLIGCKNQGGKKEEHNHQETKKYKLTPELEKELTL